MKTLSTDPYNVKRRQRGLKFQLQGLTYKGTPRKNRVWPECHGQPVQEGKNIRGRHYTASKNERGLTKRGTPPKNQRHPELAHLPRKVRLNEYQKTWAKTKRRQGIVKLSPLDRAWRELRAGMEIPAEVGMRDHHQAHQMRLERQAA